MVDYVFKPYDPISPELFQKEKERLQQFLTGNYKLEHFGSTAVRGLGGKGIIDIYCIAPKEELQKTFEEIRQAGYEERPNSHTNERFVYVRELMNLEGKKERYHLHITFKGSFEQKKDLAFRDYLRSHPDDVKRYAQIKEKAAKEANNIKDEYMRIKQPIIAEILKKALQQSNSDIVKGKVVYKEIYEPQKWDNPYYHPDFRKLAMRNFKGYIALLYYLLTGKKENFDLIIGSGDSGIGMLKVVELLCKKLNLPIPFLLQLPLLRYKLPETQWSDKPEDFYDNSVLLPLIKKQVKDINDFQNVLFVDDEISNQGLTSRTAIKLLLQAKDISHPVTYTIIAENFGLEWKEPIPHVTPQLYQFSQGVEGIYSVISYVIPYEIEKQISEHFSDKEVGSKEILNILLELPIKERVNNVPQFMMTRNNNVKAKVPHLKELQKTFQYYVDQLINEAIEEYNDKKIEVEMV